MRLIVFVPGPFSDYRDTARILDLEENYGVSKTFPLNRACWSRSESPAARSISVREPSSPTFSGFANILFRGKQHPKDMGQTEIEAYLNYLASQRKVSASTQSGALNAIAFLYRAVLQEEMPELNNLRRIKRHQTIPVVMSQQEVLATFARMHGTTRLMAEIIDDYTGNYRNRPE